MFDRNQRTHVFFYKEGIRQTPIDTRLIRTTIPAAPSIQADREVRCNEMGLDETHCPQRTLPKLN